MLSRLLAAPNSSAYRDPPHCWIAVKAGGHNDDQIEVGYDNADRFVEQPNSRVVRVIVRGLESLHGLVSEACEIAWNIGDTQS